MRADPDRPFLLHAFDLDRWCPVLSAKIEAADIDALRTILGAAAASDPGLDRQYDISADQLDVIERVLGVRLDMAALGLPAVEVRLSRARGITLHPPYLVHTGYELPLLLDGRKKLANMYLEYPPSEFPGEAAFDTWVARGVLHKEVFLEPFDHPKFDGVRHAYYTPKGEEWRIPAFRMMRSAARRAGWNDSFERMEGMLYGYEDWQNDWWIARRAKDA